MDPDHAHQAQRRHPKKELLRRSVSDLTSAQAHQPSSPSTSAASVVPQPTMLRSESAPVDRSRNARRSTSSRRQVGAGPDAAPPATSLIPEPNEFLLQHQNRSLAIELRARKHTVGRLRRRLARVAATADKCVRESAVIGTVWQQMNDRLAAAITQLRARDPTGRAAVDPIALSVDVAKLCLLPAVFTAVCDSDGCEPSTHERARHEFASTVGASAAEFVRRMEELLKLAVQQPPRPAEHHHNPPTAAQAMPDAAIAAEQRAAMLEAQCAALRTELADARRGAKRARRDLARIKQDNPDLVANGAMARPRKKQKAKRQTDKQSKAEAPSAAAGSGASTAATSAVAVNKSTVDPSGVVDELAEAKRVVSQQAEQLEQLQRRQAGLFERTQAQADECLRAVDTCKDLRAQLERAREDARTSASKAAALTVAHASLQERLATAQQAYREQMAGTSASEPVVARSCEHCATALSQRASVQAQLAVLQADASRVAALQELCDKQQAALERHSKLRREVLAGADGTDKERRRVSAATQPLRARIDKLAGILADKDRQIEALKTRERADRRTAANSAACAAPGALDQRVVQLTEEAQALERHLQETREQYWAARRDCERGRAEIKTLKAELVTAQAEAEDLIQEVEELSREFEGTAAREAALLSQLREKDAQIAKLSAETARHRQLVARAREGEAAAKARADATQVTLATCQQLREREASRLQVLHSQMNAASTIISEAQAAAAQAQESEQAHRVTFSKLSQDYDVCCAKLAEAVKQCNSLRQDGAHKELALARALGDVESLQKRLGKLGNDVRHKRQLSGADSNARVQLKELQTLLTCSVCHDRLKDCVISKCFHTFCRPCIDERVRTRQRKCPGCGEKFGSDDVHKIHLT